MGEGECGFEDVADSAGAESGVLEGGPAGGEDGKAAFAEAAQGALEGVAGAVVDVEIGAVGWVLDGDVDAVACALVAGVGKDGGGFGCGVGGGEHVGAGGLDAWTEPGSTLEVQIGIPFGVNRA